jgi:hypothetical protein
MQPVLPRMFSPATSAVRGRTRKSAGRRIAPVMVAATLAACSFAAMAQDKPVAEATTQNGKVRVEVLSLKRIEGNLVTLRWRIVNEGSGNFSMTPGNMRLVDLAGRRQYEPGLMSSRCYAEPDARADCWATFAAPPAATKTLAVKFYEQFDLLTGVPVTD